MDEQALSKVWCCVEVCWVAVRRRERASYFYGFGVSGCCWGGGERGFTGEEKGECPQSKTPGKRRGKSEEESGVMGRETDRRWERQEKLTAAPRRVEAEIPEARRSDAARERVGCVSAGGGLVDCVEVLVCGRGANALRRKMLGFSSWEEGDGSGENVLRSMVAVRLGGGVWSVL